MNIRHTLSHSNVQVSGEILEDAVSFIFAWYKKNFEFHLTKMPEENYEDNREYYQHRSFTSNHFNYNRFQENLSDLFFNKLDPNSEKEFLEVDLRHVPRYDLNLFLSYLVKIIDTIILIKASKYSFDFFQPTLKKITTIIFKDIPTYPFCRIFLNKLFSVVLKHHKESKNTQNDPAQMKMFAQRRDIVYNFIAEFLHAITNKNTKLFHIYFPTKKSENLRWFKLVTRFLTECDHFFPKTSKVIYYLFSLIGNDHFSEGDRKKLFNHLVSRKNQYFPSEEIPSVKDSKIETLNPQ